jgi:peptidoglycan hydrolase-like protein with peptidoglycan-binding domain
MAFRFKNFPYRLLFFIFLFLIFIPFFSFADEYGEKRIFNVDPNYDYLKRERIFAILIKVSQNGYFYVEEDWWQALSSFEKEKYAKIVSELAKEFDTKIYPTLTTILGQEWKPGIDKDERITILLHRMKTEVGGYFREADEYEKSISPTSNQREMVYLNLNFLEDPAIKPYLAHEFTHLITFNQKNRILNVEEETWLTELRSEGAPAILGYKEHLEARKNLFLKNPKDSLVEWKNTGSDYGIVSMFANYLYDYYGQKIFSDTLYSTGTSISAIEEYLKKNNFKENFSDVFRNWAIAVLVEDCSLGEKYCYKNEALKNLKILPETNFLPLNSESSLVIFRSLKDWEGDWQRFIGGYGNLYLEFNGEDQAIFDVSYLLCDKLNKCQIGFLRLDQNQDGKIFIPDFDKNYLSLTLITFSKTKTSDFEKEMPYYSYSLKISSGKTVGTSLPPTTTPSVSPKISCTKILNNLKYGMRSPEVKCLQEFLKAQGPEIYPEGLVTGYFGPLTLAAVKRFQQKYWQEILAPWGLTKDQPTGFVGPTTRSKINQLLASQTP